MAMNVAMMTMMTMTMVVSHAAGPVDPAFLQGAARLGHLTPIRKAPFRLVVRGAEDLPQ